jgi:hypothetical protein
MHLLSLTLPKKYMLGLLLLSGILVLLFLPQFLPVREGAQQVSPDSKWTFSVETRSSIQDHSSLITFELSTKSGKYAHFEYPLASSQVASARNGKLAWEPDSSAVTARIPCFEGGSLANQILFAYDIPTRQLKIETIKP